MGGNGQDAFRSERPTPGDGLVIWGAESDSQRIKDALPGQVPTGKEKADREC